MTDDIGWPPMGMIEITNKDTVVCENWHTKVYIRTDRTGKVVYCGYCNTGFRYQE